MAQIGGEDDAGLKPASTPVKHLGVPIDIEAGQPGSSACSYHAGELRDAIMKIGAAG